MIQQEETVRQGPGFVRLLEEKRVVIEGGVHLGQFSTHTDLLSTAHLDPKHCTNVHMLKPLLSCEGLLQGAGGELLHMLLFNTMVKPDGRVALKTERPVSLLMWTNSLVVYMLSIFAPGSCLLTLTRFYQFSVR